MRTKFAIFQAAAVISATIATAGLAVPAQAGPGVKAGQLTQNATTNGAQTNLSIGDKNTLQNRNCVVEGSVEVSGHLQQTCTLNGAQTNLAIGKNNKLSNENGVVSGK